VEKLNELLVLEIMPALDISCVQSFQDGVQHFWERDLMRNVELLYLGQTSDTSVWCPLPKHLNCPVLNQIALMEAIVRLRPDYFYQTLRVRLGAEYC